MVQPRHSHPLCGTLIRKCLGPRNNEQVFVCVATSPDGCQSAPDSSVWAGARGGQRLGKSGESRITGRKAKAQGIGAPIETPDIDAVFGKMSPNDMGVVHAHIPEKISPSTQFQTSLHQNPVKLTAPLIQHLPGAGLPRQVPIGPFPKP